MLTNDERKAVRYYIWKKNLSPSKMEEIKAMSDEQVRTLLADFKAKENAAIDAQITNLQGKKL